MNDPIYVASSKERSKEPIRITQKGCVSTTIIFIGIVIGGIVGFIAGGVSLSKGILPSWSKYEIDTQDLEIQEILNAYFHYEILERKSNDIIYVKTTDGQIHSFSRTSESWKTIEPYADGKIKDLAFSYSDMIAITYQDEILLLKNNKWEPQVNKEEYSIYGESQPCTKEWLSPPIWRPIKDSEGAVFEHALATETFCTVLLENGHLQSWYHQVNVFSMIYVWGFWILLGAIGGLLTSFHIKKRFIET